MLTIIIVGGGLAGLSAAIGLARSGHRVILFEGRETFTELGAGIQMPPNFTRIMHDWGLFEQVRAKAAMPKSIMFRSYRDGQVLYEHHLSPNMEKDFGMPYLMIHRKDILGILVNAARQLQVDLRVNSPVVRVDPDKQTVTTADGETFMADVIVGADGERSLCRSIIVGPDRPQPTNILVYRFTIDPDVIRQDPELRYLVDPPVITCWLGPRSHAVVYDLPQSGIFNVALTRPDPESGRVQIGPRDADLFELREFFSDWDPTFLKLVNAASGVSFWTLLQVPEENRTWLDREKQRIVLIGDAAHAMTPYLAQGASQSVEDGAFLQYLFPQSTPNEEVAKRLNVYCERRKLRALAVRAQAQLAGEVLEMEDGPEQKNRDLHLLQVPPTKGFPIAHADPVLQSSLYEYDVQRDVKTGIDNQGI